MFKNKKRVNFEEEFEREFLESGESLSKFTFKKVLKMVGLSVLKVVGAVFLIGVFIHALIFSDAKNKISSEILYTPRVVCDIFEVKVHFSQNIKEDCDKKYVAIEGLAGVYAIEFTWQDKSFLDSFKNEAELKVNKNQFQTRDFESQKVVLPNLGGFYFDEKENKLLNEVVKERIAYTLYAVKEENESEVFLTPNIEFKNYYLNVNYRLLLGVGSEDIWNAVKERIVDTLNSLEIKR